ncbi:hypothetical protein J1G34_16250 [Pseudomonas sp. Wu6]|uniref:hypothetical protein n=1 Tax=Pseudomonas sp. Wu6 TaxID=1210129 RepID=UPI001CA71DB9|nr:hypothetical protein [Pseudomonas sp. Wu6]MBY8930593.1 hypothetical protein [Pseudomonas sp. Wu6]
MNLLDEAPSPNKNGVSGAQTQGSATEILSDVAPPLTGELLPRTFMGLTSENPTNFGGVDGARVLNAMINDLTFERDEAKNLATETQSKLDKSQRELHDERIKNVRFEERLGGAFKLGIAQRLCTFLSPILFSVGIDVFKNSPSSAYIIFGIATLLLSTNMIPSRGKS